MRYDPVVGNNTRDCSQPVVDQMIPIFALPVLNMSWGFTPDGELKPAECTGTTRGSLIFPCVRRARWRFIGETLKYCRSETLSSTCLDMAYSATREILPERQAVRDRRFSNFEIFRFGFLRLRMATR